MTPQQAFEVHAAMRQHGISGTITAVTPEDSEGAWLVLDEAGDDVTDRVLTSVARAAARRPERGFVVAR
ncbi:hypothetical protein [Streptomyces virginiae]